ncbi:phosphoribosylamine--glycine ligase [bacterium]|nr:phosphoribosylamine--glycine ligase [bacterium]
MRILVIGGGGREHALVWKLAQSKRVTKLYCAPGNAGIAAQAECVPLSATDVEGLAQFAEQHRIDFTVVGPEAPLCAGLVDLFQARGLAVFGPTQRAAQLEGSKVFSKRLLEQAGVPTARAEVFTSADEARTAVRTRGAPVVVKADGLAAGKGVIVAATVAEAEQAIADIMEQRVFGAAGTQLVIEDCLRGPEVSVMALVDGQTCRVLATAQDHKRALDGDRGPNTGGMGAYSPTPVVREDAWGEINTIFARTLTGLQAEGIEYRGVLYAGLMLTSSGYQVLEFNCRFGDPETQAVLPRLDGDLLDALEATAAGRLDSVELSWKKEHAACVVMAAPGYPARYPKGLPISGLAEAGSLPGVAVFHAGTKRDDQGRVITDGGRVLGVTALGPTLAGAVERAYEATARIHFDGAHYRRDIAARVLDQ